MIQRFPLIKLPFVEKSLSKHSRFRVMQSTGMSIKKLAYGALVIFLGIILLGLASAVDTSIKVKTLGDHKVSIFVYEAGKTSFEQSYHLTSDIKGDVALTHSSGSSKIDVLVKVTKDGQKVFLKKFESYEVGVPISIRLDYTEENGAYAPDAPKNDSVVNNTNDEATANNTVENSAPAENSTKEDSDLESNEPVTGKAVGGENRTSSIIYYIIGIFAVLLFVLFGIRIYNGYRARKNGLGYPAAGSGVSPSAGKSIGSGSGLRKTGLGFFNTSAEDKELRKVEGEIKHLQEEVNSIKNRDARIKAAEAKFEADKRELERLRRKL